MKYRLFGKSGLRVSELALGTMTFGEVWGWGASREESRRIFDVFVEAGGNFIDTANNYTDGTSEEYVGEFVRSNRDYFVVASKYTLSTSKDDPNAGGNHRKNLVQAVEASLKRLGTDYIDIYWLHMWDYMTPVEEVMRSLDDLVRSGKVLYIGISDSPAWVVSQANTLAELRGWVPFVGLQAPYNLASRDIERDLLPMSRQFGLTVTTWAPMSGGVLTGKYNSDADIPRRYGKDGAGELQSQVAQSISVVAEEIGQTPAQVAINWVRQQRHRGDIIPIVGARTAVQMQENLGSLDFELTEEQIQRLSAANEIKLGFPHSFLDSDHVRELIFGNTYSLIEARR